MGASWLGYDEDVFVPALASDTVVDLDYWFLSSPGREIELFFVCGNVSSRTRHGFVWRWHVQLCVWASLYLLLLCHLVTRMGNKSLLPQRVPVSPGPVPSVSSSLALPDECSVCLIYRHLHMCVALLHVLPGADGREVMDTWPAEERKIISNTVRDMPRSL